MMGLQVLRSFCAKTRLERGAGVNQKPGICRHSTSNNTTAHPNMPATVRPDEIAFNKASVALARSQALISSWLPAQSAAETKSQAQIDEDDPFKPEPELWVLFLRALGFTDAAKTWCRC